MIPSSSLIISTYNWPEALLLCLKSVLAQKTLPNEVLIADDGSNNRTRDIITLFQKQLSIPLKHIWHEDDGFRLAKIRNQAIAEAKYNYIIQIDGDMILHPFFIDDHLKFAQENSVVRTSRLYINETLSKKILEEGNSELRTFKSEISNKFSGVRIPFLWPLFETSYKSKQAERFEIHGCNMAFWRKDAIEVNGYNETFKGWGPEDKEFLVRLMNKGVKKRFLKLGGIAYHIFHPVSSKAHLAANEMEFQKAIQHKLTYCQFGIKQYL